MSCSTFIKDVKCYATLTLHIADEVPAIWNFLEKQISPPGLLCCHGHSLYKYLPNR